MTEKVKEKNCMYGYGFYIYASDDQLRRFIEKHRRTICELLDAEGRRLLNILIHTQEIRSTLRRIYTITTRSFRMTAAYMDLLPM